MSRPRDLVRSLVRTVADGARKRLEDATGLETLRDQLRELAQQRLPVSAQSLCTAVAHLDGVESASVTVDPRGIHVDVAFEGGRATAARIVPTRIRFAPRGAKELTFRVDPPEAARGYRLGDVVGALAGPIAATLWPLAQITREKSAGSASIDRDGEDGFTLDLRTVPAVRALSGNASTAILLEVIELGDVSLRDGAVVLQLRLPNVGV